MRLKENAELQSGKYRILRVLGQGGFGITYLAEHTMLDKQVAIKEFFPKEYCDRDADTSHIIVGTQSSIELVAQLKNKFVKEARNISRLNHPNIITIHDIFQENETAYYVMEYVAGASLSEMVKRQGAMDEDIAVSYIRKIADAVGYMHSMSMNHLDLKPANIMVRETDGEPILIDFGLSKQYDASGGQTSTTPVGISHGFAPIEQYRPGGVSTFTPQTDIYALGATLYNLLSGSVPPHYSDILEDGLPELPPYISPEVGSAIEHAMEIKKNKRTATIADFLTELGKENVLSRTQSKPASISPKPELKADVENPAVEEETVMISTVKPEQKVVEKKRQSGNEVVNGVEFVDLGLSVKWASINIGAKRPGDSGSLISRADKVGDTTVAEWFYQGAQIPTIAQFEELRNNCTFEISTSNYISGYKVTGKNGKSIFLPFGSDDFGFMVLYGRLMTREAYNSANTLYYYFEYRPGGYKCQSYLREYSCPVRMILP